MVEQDEILEVMQKRIQYHEAEILKIKNAISAYKGELDNIITNQQPQKREVKWTQEVDNALKSGDALTVDDIKQCLLDNGIEVLNESRGRSALMTTLRRMLESGKLIKTDSGKYQKPNAFKRRTRIEPDNVDPLE